ncbi:NTTRR-F1 domain [Bacillus benzoevorans]|uniref:NTTRR-F1 domain n=1 Tax=Bacillus benzoevorans TaxID=1456 RepID=UPI0016230036|nr:NTTRR-F1 domain [Bacillus benzoevorans]
MISNRIVNGGFESGQLLPFSFTGGGSSGVRIVSGNSHSGPFSARILGGSSTITLSQSVPITPGENFEFCVSLAKIGTNTSPPISIVITYRDSSSNPLATALMTNFQSGRLPNNDERDWMEIYRTTTIAPDGTTDALVQIIKSGLSNSASIVVDDVALLAVTGTGPQGPPGPQGPQGPPGPSGGGPALFVSTGPVDEFIPSKPDDFFIMDIVVTTTEANQRVLLDGYIETIAKAYADPGGFPTFDISLLYFLFRGTATSPSFLKIATVSGRHLRPDFEPPGGLFYTWTSILKGVDIPGPAGTYEYQVIVRGAGVAPFDELSCMGGLTATVYPPAAQ